MISIESKDIPGGSFADGSLRIRTSGDKTLVEHFENLQIKSFNDGGKIILKDIAEIKETYDDSSILQYINGNPAVEISVRRSKTSDALNTAAIVEKELIKFKKENQTLLR